MEEGYIKIYRKITESDVFFDKAALQVFIWVLTSVDRKTGTLTTGRIRVAESLKMPPSTFYKILKRLQKKYQLVNIRATSKCTAISVINWDKYQSNNVDKLGITQKESKTEQQSSTKQEYKNKKQEYKRDVQSSSPDYLKKIPKEDLKEYLSMSSATEKQVLEKGSELYDYCKSKGRAYKDYKAFLRNALRKDYPKRVSSFDEPIRLESTGGWG